MSEQLISPGEIEKLSQRANAVLVELEKAILGQSKVLRLVWTALLAQGHVLLEGLPGLGKTQIVKSLSSILSLPFQRVQFTPDLLPSDITGSPILEETEQGRKMVFHKGPLFASLVLADEINRASPKTQAALLEAMQERQVTAFGKTYLLPEPFFVMATQNPIELEGTYPLPEAQLDRFLFKVHIGNISAEVLQEIISTRVRGLPPALDEIMDREELIELQTKVQEIYLPDAVANYISRLVLASHPDHPTAAEEVKNFVRYGPSPRAGISISSAARAHALLAGRPNVSFDDVQEVAPHALVHRLVLNYGAKLEQMSQIDLARIITENTQALAKDLPEGLTSD